MLTQMIQEPRFRTRYGGALWITLACFDTFALIQITFKEYFGLIDGILLWLQNHEPTKIILVGERSTLPHFI